MEVCGKNRMELKRFTIKSSHLVNTTASSENRNKVAQKMRKKEKAEEKSSSSLVFQDHKSI